MSKWEYKVVKSGSPPMEDNPALENMLLGYNGWELVWVVREPKGYWWFFKRPVEEPADNGLPTINEAFQAALHAKHGRTVLFERVHAKTGEKLRVFTQAGKVIVDTPSGSCWLSPQEAWTMAMAILATLPVTRVVESPSEEGGP